MSTSILPDASLAGTPVVTVLGPVAGDHLVRAVVPLQGEVDLQHVRAGLYQTEDPVTLGHLLLPWNPGVLHVVIDQLILHHHTETEQVILKRGPISYGYPSRASNGFNYKTIHLHFYTLGIAKIKTLKESLPFSKSLQSKFVIFYHSSDYQ